MQDALRLLILPGLLMGVFVVGCIAIVDRQSGTYGQDRDEGDESWLSLRARNRMLGRGRGCLERQVAARAWERQ